jgi:hypothetical protein
VGYLKSDLKDKSGDPRVHRERRCHTDEFLARGSMGFKLNPAPLFTLPPGASDLMAPWTIIKAAFIGDLQEVRRLVQQDRGLLHARDRGYTALTAAASRGHIALIR